MGRQLPAHRFRDYCHGSVATVQGVRVKGCLLRSFGGLRHPLCYAFDFGSVHKHIGVLGIPFILQQPAKYQILSAQSLELDICLIECVVL